MFGRPFVLHFCCDLRSIFILSLRHYESIIFGWSEDKPTDRLHIHTCENQPDNQSIPQSRVGFIVCSSTVSSVSRPGGVIRGTSEACWQPYIAIVAVCHIFHLPHDTQWYSEYLELAHLVSSKHGGVWVSPAVNVRKNDNTSLVATSTSILLSQQQQPGTQGRGFTPNNFGPEGGFEKKRGEDTSIHTTPNASKAVLSLLYKRKVEIPWLPVYLCTVTSGMGRGSLDSRANIIYIVGAWTCTY